MSKTLGNAIWGLDILRNYSVDLTRFYLTLKSAPEDSLSMDVKEMNARPYQVINTLYHLHVYLGQNAPLDGFDFSKHTLPWSKRKRLLTAVDRWLLAKLRSAEGTAMKSMEEAKYNEAARALEDLIITHASQTYVRLVRGELWRDDSEGRNRRLAIYSVLGHVLRRVDALLHPVAPFVTEYLYQEVFSGPRRWRLPLLTEPLGAGPSEGATAVAERTVEFALAVEEACNSARVRAKLKRRWPLGRVTVLVPKGKLVGAASSLVVSLCNVKEVEFITRAESFPASFELAPNSARVGAQFKERTKDVLAALSPMRGQKAVSTYLSEKPHEVRVRNESLEVPLTLFDLVTKASEGYEVGEKRGVFVAIKKARDERLVAEGLARDVARRLQALRKVRGYSPTAVLWKASVAGLEEEEVRMLEPLKKELAFLVRVKHVFLASAKEGGENWAEEDLDGRPVYLDVS
jgi:isoleucyl-tRNA synthetase